MNSHIKRSVSALLLIQLTFLTACCPSVGNFSPTIEFSPQVWNIDTLPDAFSPLTKQECSSDFGKEIMIGKSFALEFDFYRAITAYKRALVLLNGSENTLRVLQCEYSIVFCYYLAQKYQDAAEYYEESSLSCIRADFPAFKELLTILYECYTRIRCYEKGLKVLELIDSLDACHAARLQVFETMNAGQIEAAQFVAQNLAVEEDPLADSVSSFFCDYFSEAKSVKKAQVLNAILPGAGYYYVGQKNAAVTSFIINALFIAATWRFFEKGDIAAALITLSLETGWYFGGINGAGLAAKQYNEHLYSQKARNFFYQERLFPIVSFSVAF